MQHSATSDVMQLFVPTRKGVHVAGLLTPSGRKRVTLPFRSELVRMTCSKPTSTA